ncbi:MAG: signal peptidase II [Oscillospiraceae bacterium]
MLIASIIIIVLLIAADQFLKFFMVNTVFAEAAVRDLIKFGDLDVIGLRYVENRGAAFSSFEGARWFLIILTVVLIVLLIVWVIRDKNKNPFMVYSAAAVIAGGIGNLIDRIRLGYVVDYIEVRLFDFAIFNFADICVVLGAICLVIYVCFIESKSEKNHG